MQGMTFREVDDQRTIESLMADDRFAVEQKMDGTRVLVEISPEGLQGFSQRNGGVLKHTAATQHLDRLSAALEPLVTFCRLSDSRVVLDGELLTGPGTYHVFDLPVWEVGGDGILAERTYEQRRVALHGILQPLIMSDVVHLVKTATTFEEKWGLYNSVKEAGAEGVMIKDLQATYEPGKRVSHSVKVKHAKEADVIALHVTRGRNEAGREVGSCTFGVYDDEGEQVQLGSCSLIGKPVVVAGDVIEVRYLFRQEGGALVQPRLMRLRYDKEPTECTFAQFPAYSREVI